MWRWTGFNMGLDLIVTFDNYTLTLKRNHSSTTTNEHEAVLSMLKSRKIYYKVTVASYNDQKQVRTSETTSSKPTNNIFSASPSQPTYMLSTELQSTSIKKNGHHLLLKMDKEKVTFPLLLSFSFLATTPPNDPAPSDGDDGNNAAELPIEMMQAQA